MTENQISAQTRARVNLQWINHHLDSEPHSCDLWAQKAHQFREAMIGTIPQRQRLQRVLFCYEQCLRLEPDNWINHYNAGTVLRELNRHVEALQYCVKAVELAPDQALPRDFLVQTLQRLGRWGQANQAYEDAVQQGCSLTAVSSGSNFPDDNRVDNLYQNPEASPDEIMQGHVYWTEASDPELFVLQQEVKQLIYLGLFRAAEGCCIRFEVAYGENVLTRSLIRHVRSVSAMTRAGLPEPLDLSPAFPLLDIADRYWPNEYHGIVDRLFMQEDLFRCVTIRVVNEFDDQIRWLLKQVEKPVFRFDDILSLVKKLSKSDIFVRAWTMASLNFIVAIKMGHPVLIVYTAMTLAEVYVCWGSPALPTILYSIAAVYAERAGTAWDYFVSAHGKAALQLKSRGELGPAVRHLRRALKAADVVQPFNRFELYNQLATCLYELRQLEEAKLFYAKAMAVEGVPPATRQLAQTALVGLEAIAKRESATIVGPTIVCHGLELQEQHFLRDRLDGELVFFTTSKHELYDSLLQAFDNDYSVRQSIVDRRTGHAYFEDSAQLCDLLMKVALEIDLPGNALMHLEMQKSIVLNNRLKYLVREKPADLPQQLWDDLQRLVSAHRRVVEEADDAEGSLESLMEFTPDGFRDAIEAKLWECSQVSPAGARQIQQKLAFGRFPRTVNCIDPVRTRILEFYPGVCFVVRPDAPRDPEAIRLPEATPFECRRLANELLNLVHEWRSNCARTGSLSTSQFECQFHALLKRLDIILFHPVADALRDSYIRNLCIVPHQALHVLPLNLLGWSEDPLGSLGDRFDVSFAPSLASLTSLGGVPGRKPERALIIANPISECPETVCPNPARNCYSLRAGEAEGDILDRLLAEAGIKAIRLPGPDGLATIETVSAELGLVDIVHVAAHGVYDSNRPEASGVILHLPETTRADGLVRYWPHDGGGASESAESAVGEVLSLDYIWRNIDMFRCRLLNLSTCSSALVDGSGRSDEYYGLVNGFLYAGVQNILGNIWPVHDHVSRVFNERYYAAHLGAHCEKRPQDIRQGGDIRTSSEIAALRFAVQGVRDYTIRTKKPFVHPLFWAGFRIIGFS